MEGNRNVSDYDKSQRVTAGVRKTSHQRLKNFRGITLPRVFLKHHFQLHGSRFRRQPLVFFKKTQQRIPKCNGLISLSSQVGSTLKQLCSGLDEFDSDYIKLNEMGIEPGYCVYLAASPSKLIFVWQSGLVYLRQV